MRKKLSTLLCLVLFCLGLSGCSFRDVQAELPGEWFVWHWYYNVEDGEDGFFEYALFYTFDNGTLTITSQDETVEDVEATYTFSGKDTIDVVYADGTTDSFQLIPSEHNGVDQIQCMNVNTNYTVTLEPISSWSE